MLDDKNVYKQRDPSGLLGVIAEQWQQLSMPVDIVDGDHDGRQITKIVIAAMGSGALAAQLAKLFRLRFNPKLIYNHLGKVI